MYYNRSESVEPGFYLKCQFNLNFPWVPSEDQVAMFLSTIRLVDGGGMSCRLPCGHFIMKASIGSQT